MALHKLSSLETILCLERGPAADGTRLDTHHLLVAVLGSIIADALSSLLPWIPDDGVLEIIPSDIEAGLAIDEDRGGVLLEVLVNAVDLAGDGEFVRGRVVLSTVEDFVVVLYASKTGDLDLGDVLGKR